ncbi:DoxX family protein [Patescibacteria group bacterium]|nr:MAG: DoxX family protein [Patescibacteria group bacterium]
MQIAFLIGRILFGGFFFLSGINHFKEFKGTTAYTASKGVPSPAAAVAVTGLMLILGGLGTIFQVYPRESAALIALFLLFVTPKMHNFWKETDPNMKMVQQTNFMKNAALLGASLIFAF